MGLGQEGSTIHPTLHRWHTACWGERDIIKGSDRGRARCALLCVKCVYPQWSAADKAPSSH